MKYQCSVGCLALLAVVQPAKLTGVGCRGAKQGGEGEAA